MHSFNKFPIEIKITEEPVVLCIIIIITRNFIQQWVGMTDCQFRRFVKNSTIRQIWFSNRMHLNELGIDIILPSVPVAISILHIYAYHKFLSYFMIKVYPSIIPFQSIIPEKAFIIHISES